MQDKTSHCLIGRGFILMLEDLTLIRQEDGVMRIILQGGDHRVRGYLNNYSLVKQSNNPEF